MPEPNKQQLKAEARAELEYRKCQRGCQYFTENYVHIEDRDAPELAVLFKLWPKQTEALMTFLTVRLSIVLKARQLGLTWLALAFALWKMLFNPGYAVVALSKREEDAKELTRRMVFILRYLPRWMAREKKTAGKSFAGPVWENTVMTVTIYHRGGEPSVFQSMSSGPDSGRSFTANLVILDEWAFQQWAKEIWSAAYPTVNRPTGGQVIGLSTAERGTLFEEIWDAATEGKNSFTPIFLPWSADPRRTQEWYEQTKRDLPDTYHAEYPETSQEAFLFSGNSVFNVEAVTARIKALQGQGALRGTLDAKYTDTGDPVKDTEKFKEDPTGWLTIYEKPRVGVPYVIGGDTAEGGHDYSVAQVLDNTTGRQVAVWRGRVDTDIFAKEMFKLGHYYNQALISIEINFDLHPVKELDRLGYSRQYKREVVDEISKVKQHKHGFKTTSATRGPLIGNLVAVVRDSLETINDIPTLEEMLTFVRNEDGKPEAVFGKHDDCVMALAIAYNSRGQQTMIVEQQPKQLTGFFHYGELLLMGYTPARIRQLRDKVKIIGGPVLKKGRR